MEQKIKVLIVDDHAILRDGLVSILSENRDIQIVGEAESGEQAVEYSRELSPDIILMDITMKGITGIEATKVINEENPDIKVIFLTMEVSEKHISSAINSGGSGYLPKNVSEEQLFHAIKTVYEGEQYFDQSISKIVFDSFIKKSSRSSSNGITKGEQLSKREIEVLKLIAEGMPNREISEKLFISVRTVDAHRNHIMKKLDLKTTADLVKYAIRNELVEL